MTPEGIVKREIKQALNTYKCLWWMPAGSTFGASGVADFLILAEGVLIAVEAKALPKSRRHPLQKRFIEKVKANGGYGAFIHAGNVGIIHKIMAELGVRRVV